MIRSAKVKESIGDLIFWATEALGDTFEDPSLEAHFLMGGLLEKSPTDVFVSKKTILDDETAKHFRELILKRKKHVPAAYLLGRKNFMGFDFEVNPFVLIPRPETELLVEWAAHEAKAERKEHFNILDVGTGSGCIATMLAILVPKSSVTGIDISSEVLETAERNASRLFLGGKVRFLSSNLYAELDPESDGVFDMIISNPPYVTRSEYESLEADVKNHEPRLALVAGDDGLSVLRPLILEGRRFLKAGGLLMLEIGYKQGAAVQKILESAGYKNIQLRKDFGGHDRMVLARKGT